MSKRIRITKASIDAFAERWMNVSNIKYKSAQTDFRNQENYFKALTNHIAQSGGNIEYKILNNNKPVVNETMFMFRVSTKYD